MTADFLLLAATIAQAVHEEGASHLPFYLLGGALALWGVLVAAFGMSQQSFPATKGARNAVMLVTTVLVVGACGSAALTG